MSKGRVVLLFCLVFQFSLASLLYANTHIKVGIYQNAPLVFSDSKGKVSGIYIDILEHVALKEGWTLEYVHDSWPECLNRLRQGKLDLLLGIAYSKKRNEIYDFTNETLLSNWARLYTRKNHDIKSVLDLEGKTVAVLKGDIYYRKLQDMIKGFDIDCTFLEVDKYAAVFKSIEGGKVNAGLITRLYGTRHEKEYDVIKTPILCCPIELRFAVPLNTNRDIVKALDSHLIALKKDGNSIYYQSLNRWFGGVTGVVFPMWVKWGLVSAGVVLLLFLMGIIVLRTQMRAKTGELRKELSERKGTEEALLESEERFKSLSENAPDIIYTLGIDGSFTYVNPAWESTLGHKRGEVIGKYFIDFAGKEDAGEYVKIFKRIRDRKKTLRYLDITLIHKDGYPVLFSACGAPNINAKGEVTGMVGLFKDITGHRKLEAQLRQALKMEAIGTLAGGIAHDFNNLLMGIQGNASLMLMDKKPAHPEYEKLKNIEKYVQDGAGLTKQLLGFARGGKYEVKSTDLNELVKNQNSMFGRTKKEITIHGKYEEDLWAVEVDQGQIGQVLLNLYVNAWQAMPGGGDLYVQTENVILYEGSVKPHGIKAGRHVKISVADSGVGMDETTQQRIFDPFFTTKGMGRGTGLGLASAYGIIKNHGGIIDLYSKKGEGTTFNIYLPASEMKVVETQEIVEEILKGTETVLLVDDEEMIIDVGTRMLEKLGYDVLVARGGKEAIEIYEKSRHRLDIVILDMIMPDVSGGEVYDRIRAIDSGIKVILSSGYSISGQAQEILDLRL